MTVAALPSTVSYLENGVSATFAVPFRFKSPQHVVAKRLYANGTLTDLAYGVDYVAAGGTTDAGGTITVTAPAPAGTRLIVRRRTPRAQSMAYTTNDRFPAKSHEGGLDNLMLVAQEIDDQAADTAARAVSVAPGSTAPLLDLSLLGDGDLLEYRGGRLQRLDPAPFAGKFYAGDAGGRLIPASGGGGDSGLRTDLAQGGGLAMIGAPSYAGTTVSLSALIGSVFVTPLSFGAIGDGLSHPLSSRYATLAAAQAVYPFVTSLAQEIDWAALQKLANSGLGSAEFGFGFNFRISTKLTWPDGMSVNFGRSRITDYSAGTGIAVQFGSDAMAANIARYDNVWIEAAVINFTSDGYIGARFVNCQRTSIDVYRVQNFTRNIDCLSRGQGFTGVRMSVSFLGDCKFGITRTTDASANSYVNGNRFLIIDWTNVVAPNGNSYGLHTRAINVDGARPYGENGNYTHFISIQPGNGVSGNVRCAALLENSALETVRIDRYESGRGPIAVITGDLGNGTSTADNTTVVYGNVFEVGLVTSGEGAVVPKLSQTGSARLNVLRWLNEVKYGNPEIAFTALHKKLKAYSATEITMTGGLHLTDNGGDPLLHVGPGGIEPGSDHIRFNSASRSIGGFIDVDGDDSFTVSVRTRNGVQGQIGVGAYDANGNRMAYPGSGAPDIKIGDGAQFNYWSALFGGCYLLGSPADQLSFTTGPNVRRVRFFLCGPGLPQAMAIRSDSPRLTPLNPDSGIQANDNSHYVGGDPSGGPAGVYGPGDIAYGVAGMYRYTTAGLSAPAWAGSTGYTAGQLRSNGANVYECTGAGTSAASGGPTGTGSGIGDGGATWRFVAARAVAAAA